MTATGSPPDRYTVVSRLFDLISGLAADKQFILYKQLVKNHVQTELFKLVVDLTEDHRLELLERIRKIPYGLETVTSLNLDENEALMRRNPRRICRVSVKCTVGERSFKSHITDISTLGLFIETNDRFALGQEVGMLFNLPGQSQAMAIRGRISRIGQRGMGVNFSDLTPGQQSAIAAFIDKEQ